MNKIVARVKYNDNLDYLNSNLNYTNGCLGMHKGLTKLRKPSDPQRPYVIIIGSDWEDEDPYGYCVDEQTAIAEILKADADHLLKKYRINTDQRT